MNHIFVAREWNFAQTQNLHYIIKIKIIMMTINSQTIKIELTTIKQIIFKKICFFYATTLCVKFCMTKLLIICFFFITSLYAVSYETLRNDTGVEFKSVLRILIEIYTRIYHLQLLPIVVRNMKLNKKNW